MTTRTENSDLSCIGCFLGSMLLASMVYVVALLGAESRNNRIRLHDLENKSGLDHRNEDVPPWKLPTPQCPDKK